MIRKKMRELEEQNDFLSCQVVDTRDMIVSLRCELDRVSLEKEKAEKALEVAKKELAGEKDETTEYKNLYTDVMHRMLEVADMARKLEEENRSLRAELKEVLGQRPDAAGAADVRLREMRREREREEHRHEPGRKLGSAGAGVWAGYRDAGAVPGVPVAKRSKPVPMCFLVDGEYDDYTMDDGFCDRGERKDNDV